MDLKEKGSESLKNIKSYKRNQKLIQHFADKKDKAWKVRINILLKLRIKKE